MSALDASGGLESLLRRHVTGDVRFDPLTRALYSTDASLYQIEPLGIVRPRDEGDVAATIALCAERGVPVIPRAGGSSLVGQCLGRGVVLDFSTYMQAVRIDPESRTAWAQPGVVLDRLNAQASVHGLAFGPDPASSDRACMGGVVANNGTGAHSIVYGMAADHLRAAEVVLADGGRARLARLEAHEAERRIAAGGLEGRIYGALRRIATEQGETVRAGFPRYWRRAGGYNLDRLVRASEQTGAIDSAALLAGSEGGLAVAIELELALVAKPATSGLVVIGFDDPRAAFETVPALLETGPVAIEAIDDVLLDLARQAPGYARDFAFDGIPGRVVLIAEYAGSSADQVREGCDRGRSAAGAEQPGRGAFAVLDPVLMARVWAARKAGVGLLMRMRGDWKPVPGIEDTAVPPDALAGYMSEVEATLRHHGVRGAYYGHASAGCIHVRPILNLKTDEGVETLGDLIHAVGELAHRYGGVQSAEHGDGLARGRLNERLFGPDIYRLMKEVKDAFDPQGILNPGKVVDAPVPTDDLRVARRAALSPKGRYAYRDDGDLVHAVEQCNGAGVCRKTTAGAMCPSYMVTLDEGHSTRGRANALRAALDGRLQGADLASDEVWSVMELCVACKACKSECPSGVDMARLKVEVTAARAAARGATPRAQLFANLSRIDRHVHRLARVANPLLASPPGRLVVRRLGIAPQRRLPPLATETFDAWWARRARAAGGRPSAPDGGHASEPPPDVVLFADTIATYHEPAIARAATAVLEAAGQRVVVPPRRCCGRPALSQGLVDVALRDMRYNVRALAPFARRGVPIVVPEPSCASALRDDMPDLLYGTAEADDAASVADHVRTFDEYVAALPPGVPRLRKGPPSALVHVHCHERSAVGAAPAVAALERVPGLAVIEPDAGCCGMAGAFGYEAEHYATSVAMAERALAPAVRAAPGDAVIVASGASCREQIAHTTGRRAKHPAELLAVCLEPAEPSGMDG